MKTTTSIEQLSIEETLSEAMKRHRIVRLHRKRLEPERHGVEGFVLAVAGPLALVQVIDPAVVLDGFQVLRIPDITGVDAGFASAAFVTRALRLRRQQPRRPAGLRLDGVRPLIETAAARFPLVTLHRERDPENRGACWIGRLVEVDDLRVTIDYVTPSATWEGRLRYQLRDVTKIEFGGRYEDALAAVAGAPPRRRGTATPPS